jgi:hypothetical protein
MHPCAWQRGRAGRARVERCRGKAESGARSREPCIAKAKERWRRVARVTGMSTTIRRYPVPGVPRGCPGGDAS